MPNKTELKFIKYWRKHDPYADQTLKHCKNCSKLLQRQNFYKELRHQDGLRSYCKQCLAEQKKKIYEKNRLHWLQYNPYDNKTLKKCYKCKQGKLCIEFSKNLTHSDGLNDICYNCCHEKYKKEPQNRMLISAQKRAKAKNLSFTIIKEDIIIPTICPLLKIPLIVNKDRGNTDNSPTLDRIDNTRGYDKDNIHVISGRANRIKSDASLLELKLIVEGLEKLFNH